VCGEVLYIYTLQQGRWWEGTVIMKKGVFFSHDGDEIETCVLSHREFNT
jgi:hypothetical protein